MKIPYDSLTLMAAATEMRRAVLGGRIQRVTQPRPLELVLTIRNRGANHMLVISADAVFARTHLTLVKQPNPPEPAVFCMICRKHLDGGLITSIEQRGFDRILDIRIETGERETSLVAELMGKHSNVILVSESGMVLDAIKRISRKQSRFREVLPGVPYSSPPSQDQKALPFEAMESDLAEFAIVGDTEATAARLIGRFQGVSPFLAEELALRASQASIQEAWADLFGAAAAGEWIPVVIRGADNRPMGAYPFPTVQVEADRQHTRETINIALDHYYVSALPRAELDASIQGLTSEIDRALAARRRKRESLLRSLGEAGRAEQYKQTGELILANLHRIEERAESVTVADLYSGGQIKIPLDPSLTPSENAESCFRRYRKVKNCAESQSEFLVAVERDIRGLEEAATTARLASEPAEVRSIRSLLVESGSLREISSGDKSEGPGSRFKGKRIRVFTTPEGWEVLYGENSEANDYLTSKVASPNDLWLHVRATPSAHVVIRTKNEPARVPASVIRRAAIIAAQHSASKHSSTVPVDYTLKKYVRRPRGGSPGAALYQNEKTIHVSPKDRAAV